MRAGEFEDGAHVLRAKIDMASPNVIMRDPVIYRIKKEPHYRTGNQWVHLPDVRLCPLPFRFHREDHPFDLHPGVRE